MAENLITRIQRYTGTAAERGTLVTTGLPLGSTFYETDTRNLYIWDLTSWYLMPGGMIAPGGGNPENVITVAISGGQYNDLSTAVAAASAGDTIIVYPGTYTDTITFPANNIAVYGMGSPDNVIIQQADANVVDFNTRTDCQIVNCTLQVTAATTAIATVTGSTGSCILYNCKARMVSSQALVQADQPCVGKVTGAGNLTHEFGEFDYFHTGATTSGLKMAFRVAAGGVINLKEVINGRVTGSGTSAITGVAFDTDTSGYLYISGCVLDITDPNATLGVGLAYLSGTAATHEFYNNIVHVTCAGATTAYGFIAIDASGTTTILEGNHLHILGATTNYGIFAGSGNTVTTTFNSIIAADNNGGTGTFNGVDIISTGLLYAGTYRPTREIHLEEMPAVYADGADNAGTVTYQHDNTNHRNFWRWSSGLANQDIDMVWSFSLPPDFDSWTATQAFYIDTRSNSVAGHVLTASLYIAAGTVDAGINGADILNASDNVWETQTDLPTDSYSAGDWIHLHIHADIDTADDTIDIARIYFTYLANN
jgi:hypothetical protein